MDNLHAASRRGDERRLLHRLQQERSGTRLFLLRGRPGGDGLLLDLLEFVERFKKCHSACRGGSPERGLLTRATEIIAMKLIDVAPAARVIIAAAICVGSNKPIHVGLRCNKNRSSPRLQAAPVGDGNLSNSDHSQASHTGCMAAKADKRRSPTCSNDIGSNSLS